MKLLITIFFYFTSIFLFGQDTIYLDENRQMLNSKYLAKFYKIKVDDKTNKNLVIEQIYLINNQIRSESRYSDYDKKKLLEKNTFWYDNGQIHIESNYKKGIRDGHFISYFENGQLKRKDLYKNGKFKNGKCWDIFGNQVPYYNFEINPKFPGGNEGFKTYLKNSIENSLILQNLRGIKLKIGFYINTDGTVSDINIILGYDKVTNEEVIRIIQNMPIWESAMQDGNKVKVRRVLPLTL